MIKELEECKTQKGLQKRITKEADYCEDEKQSVKTKVSKR